MKINIESHMHAEAILRADFADEFDEVLSVLQETPVVLRTPTTYEPPRRGGPLKRQFRSLRGNKAFLLLPVDQGGMNLALDGSFRDKGWVQQPFVDELRQDRKLSNAFKGDFAKNRIFMEVEFGNTASMFRDLFKFHMASRTGDAEVGILVVARQTMATMFDSGVATFEAAQRLLPFLKIGVQIPICVIGIEPDDWQPVRNTYEHMKALCQANGEACHGLDVVLQLATEEQADAEDAELDAED